MLGMSRTCLPFTLSQLLASTTLLSTSLEYLEYLPNYLVHMEFLVCLPIYHHPPRILPSPRRPIPTRLTFPQIQSTESQQSRKPSLETRNQCSALLKGLLW